MGEVDRNPPYLQVVEALRAKIVNGELSEGDRVPSVRQLSADWKIAQATAMKVLAALRADGLVESVVGRGTVVRTRRLHRSASDRFESVLRTGRIYPPGEYAVITEAGLSADIPSWVRDLFGLDEGEQLVKRRRVTRSDEGPLSTSTSYLAAEFAEAAPQLLEKERIIGGTPSVVHQITGKRTAETAEATTAAEAGEEEARALEIPVGAAVTHGRNVAYDNEGGIIEVGESYSVPGRWKFNRRRHEQ